MQRAEGRRVRPRRAGAHGRLTELLIVGLEVALESTQPNSVAELAAWALRVLGLATLRAALRRAIGVPEAALSPVWCRALRAQLAELNAEHGAG